MCGGPFLLRVKLQVLYIPKIVPRTLPNFRRKNTRNKVDTIPYFKIKWNYFPKIWDLEQIYILQYFITTPARSAKHQLKQNDRYII